MNLIIYFNLEISTAILEKINTILPNLYRIMLSKTIRLIYAQFASMLLNLGNLNTLGCF